MRVLSLSTVLFVLAAVVTLPVRSATSRYGSPVESALAGTKHIVPLAQAQALSATPLAESSRKPTVHPVPVTTPSMKPPTSSDTDGSGITSWNPPPRPAWRDGGNDVNKRAKSPGPRTEAALWGALVGGLAALLLALAVKHVRRRRERSDPRSMQTNFPAASPWDSDDDPW
jgi:hypothetical protein